MHLSQTPLVAAFLSIFVAIVEAKACKPDVCSLVVQGKDGQSPGQVAQHEKDCSSFLSVTVIPATSTVYEILSSTVGTSSDTIGIFSSTETDTITVSSTVTDVSMDAGATTVESTDTTTTTTTSTHTSTETVVSSSTWTLSTTTTTSITGTSSATDVIVSIVSETDTSTTTATTTHTSTSTSTSYSFQAPAKRSAVSEADSVSVLDTTISPSHIPNYATAACANSASLYSSACAARGVLGQTTTLPAPVTTVTQTVSVVDTIYVSGHTVVTVHVSVTSTATVDSIEVSSTTVTDISSATETDTLTLSATVTSTSIIPVEVISTKTDISSTAITQTTTTTTTSTDTTSTTLTVSRTVSSVVPWCTNLAVVRGQGCYRSEWTLYCNQVIHPLSSNPIVFNAPQQSLQECLNICDANGFCTSGYFNGVTGECVLYLYAGQVFVQLVGTAGAVTAFEFIYGTNQGRDGCLSYECPDASQPQCCGGSGCPDYQPPYGA